MKLLPLFLVLMVRSALCRFLSAQVSKVYFQLLKSDDQVEDELTTQSRAGAGQSGPTQDLSIDDILEKEINPLDPLPRDLNSTFLYHHLGSRFDADFMSVRDPRNRADTSTGREPVHGRHKARRSGSGFLKLLRSARLQDGSKINLNVTKKERARLDQFLSSYTACPLKQSWKFLGVRFWPPWVKESSCYTERSCSFPPGMTCKESSYTYKVILRWECTQSGQFCKWRNFPYRMSTGCKCSC